jgi:hypothetical protein
MTDNTFKQNTFVLKEDGKIFFVPDVPKEPNHIDYKCQNEFKEWMWKSPLHKNRYSDDYDHYTKALQSAIDNGIEVSNQDETLQYLPYFPEKGKLHTLNCRVEILPWSTLRILSTGDDHKKMPLRGNGAHVTFPEDKPEQNKTDHWQEAIKRAVKKFGYSPYIVSDEYKRFCRLVGEEYASQQTASLREQHREESVRLIRNIREQYQNEIASVREECEQLKKENERLKENSNE